MHSPFFDVAQKRLICSTEGRHYYYGGNRFFILLLAAVDQHETKDMTILAEQTDFGR